MSTTTDGLRAVVGTPRVDAKKLDEMEAEAKAEIASVDDPSVVFYPAWEKGALKKQIEEGRSKPQATANLIADLRDARAVLEQVRLLKTHGATRETAKALGLEYEYFAHGSLHVTKLVWARADAVLGLKPEGNEGA